MPLMLDKIIPLFLKINQYSTYLKSYYRMIKIERQHH